MVDREDVLGLNVGRLYAVNTFGAVAGTFCVGFVLIPALGVPNTTLAAANGNFLLGAHRADSSASRLIWRRAETAGTREPEARGRPAPSDSSPPPPSATDKAILGLAFASGLAILALEVVWTRSLVLILGSTTYAFSTMLVAVLRRHRRGQRRASCRLPIGPRTGVRWWPSSCSSAGCSRCSGPAHHQPVAVPLSAASDWAGGAVLG